MKKRNLLGLGLCLFLSSPELGFAKTKAPIISGGERYGNGQAIAETYHLGPGDKVKVNVFNELQLSGEYQVGVDGTISLPLVGSLTVTDETPAQVSAAFEQMLGNDFLRNPRVTTEVTLYRPFFIVGEVHTPGQYPYSAGLTVWNAIATSQGITPRGRVSYVYIRKYGSPVEERFELTPDLRVFPGDTIRIAERFF